MMNRRDWLARSALALAALLAGLRPCKHTRRRTVTHLDPSGHVSGYLVFCLGCEETLSYESTDTGLRYSA